MADMSYGKIKIEVDGKQAIHSANNVSHAVRGMGTAASQTAPKMSKMTTVLSRFGPMAIAATVALTAFKTAVSNVSAATKFEQALADLSAITGAVGKDLKFLSDAAIEFGSTTTLSAAEAAEGFKLVASAKPELLEDAEALKSVTAEVLKLSEASGMSLSEAAIAAGSALNQFSAGASEANRFVNVLAAGAKYGASEIRDTAEALKMSGVVAANTGVSFEQTNAAIQILAAGALKGSMAGTGLKGVLLKLSTQARNEFNPAIVGMQQAMINLRDAELSTIEQKKLFGEESITSAQLLMREAEQIGVLTEKLTGTQTAYEQAAVRTNTFQGSTKRLSNAWNALNLEISASNGLLKKFADWGTKALNAVAAKMRELKDTELKALELELGSATRRLKSVEGGGLIQQWMYGTKADLEQDIEFAKARIEDLKNVSSEPWATKLSDTFAGPHRPVAEKTPATAERDLATEAAKKAAAEKEELAAETAQKEAARKATELERWRAGEVDKMTALEESYMTQLEREEEFYANRRMMIEQAWDDEIIGNKRRTALLEKEEDRHNKAIAKADAATKAGSLRDAGTFFNSMMSLTQGKSKELFAIMKVGAVATAIVDSYVAYDKALASLPPPYNYVAAAAVLAAGMAKVQAIQSTNYGSTGGAGGTGSGGGNMPQPIPAVPTQVDPLTGSDGQNTVKVEILGDIYGFDEYVEEKLINAIRSAVDDRDVVLISGGSRNAQEIVSNG